MINAAINARQGHHFFSQSPSKVSEGMSSEAMSLGMVVAMGAATIIAFHAIGLIAQMIVTPLVLGITIGVAVHISLYGPKESLECATEILKKIPDAMKRFITNAPVMMEQLGSATLRCTKASLQYVGSKVNPPSNKPYTMGEVAHGLAKEGATLAVEAHKKASPVIIETAKSSAEIVRNKAIEAYEFAAEKLTKLAYGEKEEY